MVKVTLEGLYATQLAQGKRIDGMIRDMEIIKNRLPNWATALLTAMTGVLSGLITHLVG